MFLLTRGFLLAAMAAAMPVQAGPPRAEAAFAATPPVVDGVLGEKEWAAARPVFFPKGEGSAPANEVRFLWTRDGLYIAFRGTDTTPVFGNFPKGDPVHQEDSFELFFDHVGDHRQYVEIQYNPLGAVFFKNYVLSARPRIIPDKSLTPEFRETDFWRYDLPVPEGFQVASKWDRRTGLWTLESFLPAAFANRRHGGYPLRPGTWRINLVRHDWDTPLNVPDRQPVFMYWAPVHPGHPHLSPTAMGYLKLLKP